MSRIAGRFQELKAANKAAFIPFITAGDPDAETTLAIMEKLSSAGADLIELGVPFSDPMADGPAIQASSVRALKGGMSLKGALALVKRFRSNDPATPLIMMGYYNPIHAYGPEAFARDAARAGVDGLIVVDLGPEEDSLLRHAASSAGIDIVRLAAPTTDDKRLAVVSHGASGFMYYVSIAGVTGTKTFAADEVGKAVARIRSASGLPCAVGFGIATPEQAATIAAIADAAVVGSAIVSRIAENHRNGKSCASLVEDTLGFCRSLAAAIHDARE